MSLEVNVAECDEEPLEVLGLDIVSHGEQLVPFLSARTGLMLMPRKHYIQILGTDGHLGLWGRRMDSGRGYFVAKAGLFLSAVVLDSQHIFLDEAIENHFSLLSEGAQRKCQIVRRMQSGNEQRMG